MTATPHTDPSHRRNAAAAEGVVPGQTTDTTALQTISPAAAKTLATLRIAYGLTFLWAFFDKTLALGYATGRDPAGHVDRFGPTAWIHGGSPTKGFLTFAADGPFKDFYHSIAGDSWANWLFMLGLLGVGTALTLGAGMRIAAGTGVLMYILMWSVVLPPADNPVLDDHLLGAISLVALALLGAGNTWGLGRWWSHTRVVEEHPVLR